jgi:hypothetical protein
MPEETSKPRQVAARPVAPKPAFTPPDVGGQQPKIEYEKVKLSELGWTLPIGYETGDARSVTMHHGLSFKEWTGEDDELIDRLRSRGEYKRYRDHHGKTVTLVLAQMLSSFGPHSAEEWGEMPIPQRISAIEKAWMTDVLTAWFMLRIDAMGETIKPQLTCPKCGHEWSWPADLSELSVQRSQGVPRFTYRLPQPMTIAGKARDLLCIEPPRWRAISNLPVRVMNGGLFGIKRALLTSALYGAAIAGEPNEPPVAIGSSQLMKLPKKVLEPVIRFVTENFPEPDTALAPVCISCEHAWRLDAPWTFDFFFEASSL